MKYKVFKQRIIELGDLTIEEKIETLCEETDDLELYDHMEHVATLAAELAEQYKLNKEHVYITGFLHDVGRLIDTEEYLDILNKHGIPVDEDEKQILDVLHGKVATLITEDVFGISDDLIKGGILYHTTLRKKPTDFEKVIFLADKMTWAYDELVYTIEETVTQSLNVACFNALKWLIKHIEAKDGLVLKNTLDAYLFFKGTVLL